MNQRKNGGGNNRKAAKITKAARSAGRKVAGEQRK